jgi:hypothetical protein
MQETISVEIGGQIFRGVRTIEGTGKLRQTITYKGLSKADTIGYSPKERQHMYVVARIILRELIQQSGDI